MKGNRLNVLSAKQVGIWIRVSTEDQAQGDSPKHHEIRARHYAQSKEWIVQEVYDLAGVSGKAVMDHPEAKRMMEDVRRGHISGLIFSKLARLTRNARELMDFSDYFREHDADLISLQENIDTGTPSGRLFYNMVAVMAQWEREEIGDRVKASIKTRAELGKPINGKVAFGYHWKDKKLVPHPEEAPVRRLIYELFAKHGRKKTVARLLNERGYRTRDGSSFSDTTVGRLIQDSTAKGIHKANFTKRVGHDKPYVLKPEHEWVLTEVEAIVSEELWQKCNDMLESRRTKLTKPTKRTAHLFAGFAFCTCGKKMYVPSNTPKYVCTACRTKIPIVDLEKHFFDSLKDYLVTPEKVTAYLDAANSAVAEKHQLLDSLRKEHQKVHAEAEQVYQLYISGGVTIPQFKSRYHPLDARKLQIEEEIPRVEAELDLLKVENLTSEHIMSEATDLHARWPKMASEEKRKIVELLTQTIVIAKDGISLNLYYLPGFEEMANGQRSL